MHEAFVRALRACFDGPEAARRAGVNERLADRNLPVLLRRPDIRERLFGYAIGLDRPDARPEAIVKDLLARTFVDLSSIIAFDPMGGQPRFDLTRARPEQINALHIKVKTVDGRQGRQRTTTTRTRSSAEILRLALATMRDDS